jgi:hypothetical protein
MLWWSSGLLSHVYLQVGNNVSEENIASIFRAEDGEVLIKIYQSEDVFKVKKSMHYCIWFEQFILGGLEKAA